MKLENIKGIRIAIIGSRNFDNYELLANTLEDYKDKIGLVVSGGANGADTFGEQWADKNQIPKLIFPADWNKHNKSAGFIRNQYIVNNADAGIAFWDNKSKGTLSTIGLFEKAGKPVKVVVHEELPF